MQPLKKVFITVKTYPTISRRYDELVCTAGIDEQGNWIRIYPMPFRKLDYEDRYKKYQWIEVSLVKNTEDSRPESHRIGDYSKFKLLNKVGTEQNWYERKQIITKKHKPYTDLSRLIKLARADGLSLAMFKPAKIIKFVIEECAREWDEEKLQLLAAKSKQSSMFQTEEEVRKELMVVKKLPYKFSYKFVDQAGKVSKMMIEDWELGALYWNCLKQCADDEAAAKQKVRQKYFDQIASRDCHLFLGTTQQHHYRAQNPFIIIGVFWPPNIPQTQLFN